MFRDPVKPGPEPHVHAGRRASERSKRRLWLRRLLSSARSPGKEETMPSNDSRLRRHRSAALAASLLVLPLAIPSASSAGLIGWNLSGGRYDNLAGTDHPYFVGIGPRVSLGSIILAPNAEWLFVDASQVYTLNLDAAMVVLPAGVASAW